MDTFANIIRVCNVILAILLVPTLIYRIRVMHDTKFVAFKAWTGVLLIGISYGTSTAIGRPFNFGILIANIAMFGLVFTTLLDEVKRRMGIGDCIDE